MEYSKPKVLIDMEEYQYLQECKRQHEHNYPPIPNNELKLELAFKQAIQNYIRTVYFLDQFRTADLIEQMLGTFRKQGIFVSINGLGARSAQTITIDDIHVTFQ